MVNTFVAFTAIRQFCNKLGAEFDSLQWHVEVEAVEVEIVVEVVGQREAVHESPPPSKCPVRSRSGG